jgi:hypothetical protein
MEFVCNLQVPRTGNGFGMPTEWATDRTVSYSSRGLLQELLSQAKPGVEVAAEKLVQHPDDPPIGESVAELERAGYLVLVGDGRYELVHPPRLMGRIAW